MPFHDPGPFKSMKRDCNIYEYLARIQIRNLCSYFEVKRILFSIEFLCLNSVTNKRIFLQMYYNRTCWAGFLFFSNRSLQSTRQKILVHFDVVTWVAVVNDTELLLLLDQSRQLEVLCSNVSLHIATVSSFKTAPVPGTLVRLRGQVHTFVGSQMKIGGERLGTSR